MFTSRAGDIVTCGITAAAGAARTIFGTKLSHFMHRFFIFFHENLFSAHVDGGHGVSAGRQNIGVQG